MLGSGTGAPVGRPPSLPCSGTLLGNKLCSHLLTSIPCRNRCPVSSRTARVVSHAASNEQPPAQPKLVTARPKLQASGVRHKEEKHPPLVVPHGNPLEGLNEEQRQAVFTDALTVRVKAGPGSGKTRVVVARTLHLITGPTAAAPSRILAITFTNKAARELKERLAGAAASSGRHIPVEMAAGGVTAMTFHSLGAYMLRVILKDGAEADGLRKGFRVVDADQSERLIMKAVFNVDSQQQQERKAWAETAGQLQGPKGGPPLLPPLTTTAAARLMHQTAELLYDIKAWAAAKGHYNSDTAVVAARAALAAVRDKVPKEPQLQDWHPPAVSGPPPSPYSEEAKEANEAAAKARWCVAQLQRYYTEYHRLLRVEHNAADFSDLLCLPTRVLDTCPEHRERWRGRWDHILVDEFQDTDSVQYLLVRLLRSPSASLFVVGDPDQSIYSWRGAQPDNMRNFLPRDYQDTKTYILPTNYRSDPAIVAKADTLLRSACDRNAMGMGARSNGEKDGDPYDLYRPAVAARPGSSGGEHAVVQSCSYSDPEEEARVIAEHIMKWNRVGAGASPAVPLREIAVLYRNRALSLPLEQELARWGIRFTVVGGQPFWEYKDVRAAVCYLHVAAHPLHSDTWLERVANEPKRGLGDATVDALRVAAAAAGLTLGGLLFGDFVHDPTGPQQLQAAPGEAGAAAAAGQGQGEEPAPAPAAAKRKTRAKAKAAEGEGTAAATGPARYAPAIPPSSPLARVKLGAKAKAGIMELRGIVRSMRLALGVEPAPAGAEPGGGEGAVGAAVKPRPPSFSSSPSPAKTVGQVVATLLGPDLTGLETAALEEAAVEVTAAGGKAAARDKGDKGSGATERLQRYGLLKQVAAAPETWVSADMPPEDAGPAPAGGPAAADVGLPGLQRFLEHIALVTSQDVDASGQRDAVRLTTIHAAKGLEFERVFVIGLEHGLLPSGRCDTREALEEELRLLYVALTRAKDQLHLSMCKGRMHQGKWDGYRRLSGLAVALGLDFPQYGGAGAAAGSGGYSGGGWPARGSGSSGGGRVPPRGLRRATMPHKRET